MVPELMMSRLGWDEIQGGAINESLEFGGV